MPEDMTFPNESFEDEIDYYGYQISLEHLLLMVKAPMRVTRPSLRPS